MKAKQKAMILSICAVLLSVATVAGTYALIFDRDALVNTFVVGMIDIMLEETPDATPDDRINIYEMILAEQEITKDPRVTVKAGSEDCWVFVKLEKSSGFDLWLEYTVDSRNWILLEDDGTAAVYYYYIPVTDAATDVVLPDILVDNTVRVKSDVTEKMIRTLEAAEIPTLTVTAYAVQWAGFSDPITGPEDAWAVVG